MTNCMLCPFCSSDKTYTLLNTHHCKRCKNMWSRDQDPVGSPQVPVTAYRPKKETGSLKSRMSALLETLLARNREFSPDTIVWRTPDISPDTFRKFLRNCAVKGQVTERKDRYGRLWYSAPDRESPPRKDR